MKVSFIIPFHNEEKNAESMIKQVSEYAKSVHWNFEIIPVNDRSNDNTKQILEACARKWKFVKPITRKKDTTELGNTMGIALVEGSKKATGDIIIWTMGDRADSPATYGAIVAKINEGYDLVFGSRYMPGGSRGNLDVIKAFFSSWGTRLAQILFGIPVHDITNAFRGFRREMLESIQLDSSGFAISPEFAIKAFLADYRLGEVPTVYFNRVQGVSSFKLWNMTRAYLSVYYGLFFAKLKGAPYAWQK